jgi:hypothetical protein
MFKIDRKDADTLQSRDLCPEAAITRQPARASYLFGSIDLMTFTP